MRSENSGSSPTTSGPNSCSIIAATTGGDPRAAPIPVNPLSVSTRIRVASLFTFVPRSVRCCLCGGTGSDIGMARTRTIFIVALASRCAREACGIVFGVVHIYGRLSLGRSCHARPDLVRHLIVPLHCRPRFHGLEPTHEIGKSGFVDPAVLVPLGPRIRRDVGDGIFVAGDPRVIAQPVVQNAVETH